MATSKAKSSERALALHKKYKGKMVTGSAVPVTKDSLEVLYTPGVGAVCSHIAEHHEYARAYTMQGRTVAVVSDGSAVLGLGNVGPEAALPVMEGKAVLFKELANVDAVPIVINTHDPDQIVETIKAIAPTFAGINLEDIAAPQCFYIEDRLQKELSIPVMHDDQHGTAIVVLAGLINAHKVTKKNMLRSRIALVGAGAAASGIAKLLLAYGVGDVVLVDRNGILGPMRTDLNPAKEELASITNKEGRFGGVLEAVAGADVVIGVSGPNTITADHVRVMAQNPIVFALANPEPEIRPELARQAGAAVIATGRSDFPNQVNNVLVFPGVFRGAIDNNVHTITENMKLRAAKALAGLVTKPTAGRIIPAVLNRRVVRVVADAMY